jgi:hypothetical protein
MRTRNQLLGDMKKSKVIGVRYLMMEITSKVCPKCRGTGNQMASEGTGEENDAIDGWEDFETTCQMCYGTKKMDQIHHVECSKTPAGHYIPNPTDEKK